MDILIEDFMCLVEKIAATSKCSQRFDTDIEIYRSEIHVIKLLGDYASLHVSEIARKFGVTRGAASQILKRLEKRVSEKVPGRKQQHQDTGFSYR